MLNIQISAVGRQITLDDIGDIKDDVGGVDFQQVTLYEYIVYTLNISESRKT